MICDKPVTGRYVIIQLAGTNYLTLCEVEVYSGESNTAAFQFVRLLSTSFT